jgi:hypothetical protein
MTVEGMNRRYIDIISTAVHQLAGVKFDGTFHSLHRERQALEP